MVENTSLDPQFEKLLNVPVSGYDVGDTPTGIPPLNLKSFDVWASNGKNKLLLEGPDDTIVENQRICRVEGVLILRSEKGYPTIETDPDATAVLDVKRKDFKKYMSTPFEDIVDNDKTYYYTAFPYSDHGVYTRLHNLTGKASPNAKAHIIITFTASEAVGCTIKATKEGATESVGTVMPYIKKCVLEVDQTGEWRVGGQKVQVNSLGEDIELLEKYWGFDWELSEPDTESSISYPAGVDNATFTPVPARGADAEIELGDWQVFHDWVGCRPVMLNYDGTVAYELDHKNQTLKKDSEEPSDISDDTKEMNAMVEFPKRYFKRWTDENGVAHFRAARLKLGDDWKCFPWMYGTTEADAIENDLIYLPMFEVSYLTNIETSTSVIRSIAGKEPKNLIARSVSLAGIQQLGPGWQFEDFADINMVMDYMFLMIRSTDVQKHLGVGHYSGARLTGALKESGPYCGTNGNTHVKFMWLEDYYGDLGTDVDGIFLLSNIYWVKNFPPYTVIPEEVTIEESGWKNLGYGITGSTVTSQDGRFISNYTYDENGMLPTGTAGSATTYVPDGIHWNSGNMGLRFGYDTTHSQYQQGRGYDLGSVIERNNYAGHGPSIAYKHVKLA